MRVTRMVVVTYTVSGCCPGSCLVWSFVLPNRVSRWEGGWAVSSCLAISPPPRCRWRCAKPRGTAAYLAVVLANAEAHTVAALDAGSASRRCHASPLRAPRRLDSGIAQRRPGTGASETWLCILGPSLESTPHCCLGAVLFNRVSPSLPPPRKEHLDLILRFIAGGFHQGVLIFWAWAVH